MIHPKMAALYTFHVKVILVRCKSEGPLHELYQLSGKVVAYQDMRLNICSKMFKAYAAALISISYKYVWTSFVTHTHTQLITNVYNIIRSFYDTYKFLSEWPISKSELLGHRFDVRPYHTFHGYRTPERSPGNVYNTTHMAHFLGGAWTKHQKGALALNKLFASLVQKYC